MHWVDRGPEPNGLQAVRDKKTPAWIAHYRDKTCPKPSDSDWRRFARELGVRFSQLCGYCEESTEGEVDHFKPKKVFPESVYEWNNWIYACHTCNHGKSEKWPDGGYVDPCAVPVGERPEKFFAFDLKSGFIIPMEGLAADQSEQAKQMIKDLKLNAESHVKIRIVWLALFDEALRTTDQDVWEKLWAEFAQPGIQLSSWSTAMLLKYRPSP